MTRKPSGWLFMASLLAGCSGDIGPSPGKGGPATAADPGNGSGNPVTNGAGGTKTPTKPGSTDPGTNAPVQASCGTSLLGPSPLRRHTNLEYDNTVADLLGDTTHPGGDFTPDTRIDNFTNYEAVQNVSSILGQQYLAAAETLATNAVAKMATLLPCSTTVAADTEQSCAQSFITNFGKRAYRRPVLPEESAVLLKVFQAGRAAGDFTSGIKFTLQAMLVAPQFLYRVESSQPIAGQKGVLLTHWEMASRLSYFLLGSMPDDALFAAAEAGKLGTKEEVIAQATRLMATPRARDNVLSFFRQWLQLDLIGLVEKDPTAFPGYSAATADLQQTEAEMLVTDVFWKNDGALETLFKAPYSFRNQALQSFYGEGTVSGDFQQVTTPAGHRGGLLTMGGLSALKAAPDATNPVTRGKYVREVILCGEVPPPPPDLNVTLPKFDPRKPTTARDRMSQHSSVEPCASCHKFMDPLGLAFENFDGSGRWRDTDNGNAIDASGQLSGTDKDGPFDGVLGLEDKLTTSDTVRGCAVRSWFRYAFGRSEVAADQCTMDTLKAHFIQAGAKMKPFLLDLVASDAFRTRTIAGGTP